MSFADVLALVASVVFLVRLLPQPVRLARRGVASGVSALAGLNAVVATLAWLVYGLYAGLPVVWGVSVLALGPGVWQVVLLRREVRWPDVAWTGALVAVLVAAAAAGLFAAALAFTVLVTAGPQLWRACTHHDLDGLAPATWWVALVDAATWGLYGVAIGDVALIGYFVVLGVTAALILLRLARVRGRVSSGAPAAAVQLDAGFSSSLTD